MVSRAGRECLEWDGNEAIVGGECVSLSLGLGM